MHAAEAEESTRRSASCIRNLIRVQLPRAICVHAVRAKRGPTSDKMIFSARWSTDEFQWNTRGPPEMTPILSDSFLGLRALMKGRVLCNSD